MSEKRYSFQTCSDYLGIKTSTIQHRASVLRIDTKNGISAEELKRIEEYKSYKRRSKRCSLNEPKEEMEALK